MVQFKENLNLDKTTMEKRYKKVSYLYGKIEFFLYTPMDIEVINEKLDSNGKLLNLSYLKDDVEHNFDIRHPYEIVKSFTPNHKNVLVSEYNDKIITAYSDSGGRFPDIKHEAVRVLVEKRGNYTMLECFHCGKQSPLAINSMYINGDEDLEGCKNKFGK